MQPQSTLHSFTARFKPPNDVVQSRRFEMHLSDDAIKLSLGLHAVESDYLLVCRAQDVNGKVIHYATVTQLAYNPVEVEFGSFDGEVWRSSGTHATTSPVLLRRTPRCDYYPTTESTAPGEETAATSDNGSRPRSCCSPM